MVDGDLDRSNERLSQIETETSHPEGGRRDSGGRNRCPAPLLVSWRSAAAASPSPSNRPVQDVGRARDRWNRCQRVSCAGRGAPRRLRGTLRARGRPVAPDSGPVCRGRVSPEDPRGGVGTGGSIALLSGASSRLAEAADHLVRYFEACRTLKMRVHTSHLEEGFPTLGLRWGKKQVGGVESAQSMPTTDRRQTHHSSRRNGPAPAANLAWPPSAVDRRRPSNLALPANSE